MENLQLLNQLPRPNKSKYIGKNLTVQFQNLTDAGIPRFPVGLEIRDYE